MITSDFPAWCHQFAALKTRVHILRTYSLSQMEHLFASLIPDHFLSQADEGPNSRWRVFCVRVTFWGFLWQVLNPRCSCRSVVRQVRALFSLLGREKIDEDDSAYCQARARLPQESLDKALRVTALEADRRAQGWRWLQRDVKIIDTTSSSLADTQANQARYPQSKSQAPGCGFPLIKLTALMSLASGAILAVAKGNKHIHELRLFRKLWNLLKPGDVVLGDDSFSDYATLASLPQRKVDGIFRLQRRHKDFRKGKRLGHNDRLVTWVKPGLCPRTMTAKAWRKIPETIEVRMVRFEVNIPGFRTQRIDLVTTLLDPVLYPIEELAALFRRRWRLELCFRDIKTTMGMEQLRCKSPDLVHKELMMYLIAYNLIRCLMAQAAAEYAVEMERISFKGSVDTVRAFSEALAQARNNKQRQRLKEDLLETLARDLLPDRPNRYEPRAVKRRPKPYPLLNKHRSIFKEIPHRSCYRKSV